MHKTGEDTVGFLRKADVAPNIPVIQQFQVGAGVAGFVCVEFIGHQESPSGRSELVTAHPCGIQYSKGIVLKSVWKSKRNWLICPSRDYV